jgi:hypothetical protein
MKISGKTGLLCHLDNACASNPCHARASCVTSPIDGTYLCSCPNGFKGVDCTEDIDECEADSPCEHDGLCVNTPGSFECKCTRGFTGPRCEIATDFNSTISSAKNVQLKANVSHIEIIPLNKNLNETTEESMEHTDLKPSTPTAENSSVSINLNHHEHSKTVSNILIRMFGRQNTFFKFHVPSKKGALQVELSANVSGMPNKSEPIEIVVGHIKDEDLDV